MENNPMTVIAMPKAAAFVIETLNTAGFQAFIVGGCVRDALLGRAPKDWDVATSAFPADVKALFPKTIDTGVAHGTVTVLARGASVEVTTFRVDGAYSDGRRPDTVAYTGELAEDLLRRDFTMNAIAYHEATGLVDPFGGAADIGAKIIRGVGEPGARFQEDALRMLRAVRFAAQLGFAIEPRTYAALMENAHLIGTRPEGGRAVSIERIRDEFMKTLLTSDPEPLRLLLETKLMSHIHVGTERYLAARLEDALPFLRACGKDPVHRLSLLFMHMAPDTCRDTLAFFRLDNKTVRETVLHARWLRAELANDEYGVRKAISAIGGERLAAVLYLRRIVHADDPKALAALAGAERMRRAILSRGDCCELKSLAINGDDLKRLGARTGAEIGRILGRLLDDVMRAPEKNNYDTLERLALEYMEEI